MICVAVGTFLSACDLQPRIMSLPDSVGDFISARYPALLADPDTQPEIYNSAASDYGVYASPTLYGDATTDDYILYSDVSDYMMPTDDVAEPVPPVETSTSVEASTPVNDVSSDDAGDGLSPDAPGDILVVPTTAVMPMYGGVGDSHEITVASGDTLYAISKKYGTSVDEIARLNNLSAPYALRAGMHLRVPGNGDVKSPVAAVVSEKPVAVKTSTSATPVAVPEPKTTVTPIRRVTSGRAPLKEVTVAPGDTLYSISRAYSVPVNDLAVINDLAAPFKLTVGTRLKVPDLTGTSAARPATTVQSSQAKVTVADKGQSAGTSGAAQKTVTTSTAKSSGGTKTSVSSNAATGTVSKSTTKSVVQKTATPAKSSASTSGSKTSQKSSSQNTSKTGSKKTTSSTNTKKNTSTAIASRSSSKFAWPVRGRILSAFGSKPSGLVNDGINISAVRGTTVRAAENGVVAYAGNEIKGMGNLIILQHADGWMTVYAHMDSLAVRRGANVSVGQKIGTVGATGKVDKPQLHFEIRKGRKAYNPSQYLK